jgi:predicted secreted hydrolase
MRNELALILCVLMAFPNAIAQYRLAMPGYRYGFPRDHFNHPDFQTEWWYYTGNVHSSDGRRFGFELTFFRQGVDRSGKPQSAWDVSDLYLAHLALSDLDGGVFCHNERTNRAGPGIAGISEHERRIWNGNWQVQWHGDAQELQAIEERFSFHFSLRSTKPPVVHGERGVSQKAEGPGRASHYISLTRLLTSGEITVGTRTFDVAGLAWMDHEFFTSQLTAEQAGWDWLSIQLDDGTELMLFHIRRKDGSIDEHSSGTFVDRNGKAAHLTNTDFSLVPTSEAWTSPASHARYPIHWRISVRSLGLELEVSTSLPSQELSGGQQLIPNYWEGAIDLTGRNTAGAISGVGYLEMTGYDHPLSAER